MDIREKVRELLPKQEKKIRKAIWWTLQELHQESDVTLSEEFDFDIKKSEFSQTEQRRAIRFLENIEVLEILSSKLSKSLLVNLALLTRNEYAGANHQPMHYELKVNKNTLFEVYQIYKSFFEDEKLDFIDFNRVSGILTYKKQPIEFSPESNSFTLLDVLINHRDELYVLGDVLNFKEINEYATSDGSIKEIPSKVFYNAVDHINKKMKKDAKIEEFLIMKNAKIGINPTLLEH